MKRALNFSDDEDCLEVGNCGSATKKSNINIADFQLRQDDSTEDAITRRAEMYQEYMKRIPIPNRRGSVIPFNSWQGLGRSMKQSQGQPLHYLTNILLKKWDQARIGSVEEDQPVDSIIHPAKAEAVIWVTEEIHRSMTSHHYLAKLWSLDPMYHAYIDAIFP